MKSRWKFAIFITFIVISISVAIISNYFFSPQLYISSFILSEPGFAAFLYIAVFIVAATFSLPLTALLSLGALFFSIPVAVVCAMTGMMISSVIDFNISRRLGRDYLKSYVEKHGGKFEQFDRVMEKKPFKQVLILSAIYFIPPAIPNFLGGLVKINLRKYLVAIFIGNLPNVICGIYLINGIISSKILQVYLSIAGIVLITASALFFYKGEIKELFFIGFPFLRKIKWLNK